MLTCNLQWLRHRRALQQHTTAPNTDNHSEDNAYIHWMNTRATEDPCAKPMYFRISGRPHRRWFLLPRCCCSFFSFSWYKHLCSYARKTLFLIALTKPLQERQGNSRILKRGTGVWCFQCPCGETTLIWIFRECFQRNIVHVIQKCSMFFYFPFFFCPISTVETDGRKPQKEFFYRRLYLRGGFRTVTKHSSLKRKYSQLSSEKTWRKLPITTWSFAGWNLFDRPSILSRGWHWEHTCISTKRGAAMYNYDMY